MSRREFLKICGVLMAGFLLSPFKPFLNGFSPKASTTNVPSLKNARHWRRPDDLAG